MGWIETEISMLSALETADKETRDNQERGRACHLRCDQHGAGVLATAGNATSAFVQKVAEICSGVRNAGRTPTIAAASTAIPIAKRKTRKLKGNSRTIGNTEAIAAAELTARSANEPATIPAAAPDIVSSRVSLSNDESAGRGFRRVRLELPSRVAG